MASCPVIVVGCKADLIDRPASTAKNKTGQVEASSKAPVTVDRLKRMTVNAQVLNELKKIDEESQIDYIEAGLSMHRGVYKVPQDDLQIYMSKLFEDDLPLSDESESYRQDAASLSRRAYGKSSSSMSESSDDGASRSRGIFSSG